MSSDQLRIRQLGRMAYEPVWQAMKQFTDNRNGETVDEFWLVEHDPVFTQGQAGKEEHLLAPGDIPVVQVDRGGQVTYHGPGQQVLYVMLDLRRRKLGVRELVSQIENAVVDTLAHWGIEAAPRPDAPGVYVGAQKICSLGLRVRKGCSFHGLALNVDMDMTPFLRINPCGYAGMEMTQIATQGGPSTLEEVQPRLVAALAKCLGYDGWQEVNGLEL
ncbi:lipoyl(octanoyl) transferase LipB [Gallaecimonas sp. GXIMD4217]|uniref:lipoyl(octanoyl) transferase LipB n=1 Tax=Gallaecimonas sp. GXIMD4217 TaxID=3131927 RepID=UPI00311B20EA